MPERFQNIPFHVYKDIFLFAVVVMVGVLIKIYKAINKGAKASFKWFLAEALISFFVALLVWATFDQFFKLNAFFTYMISAWAGSLSTTFHQKLEDLLGSIFESLKGWFTKKLED
ncbi:MAG: hypothetical protein ACK4K1_02475 [Flavobacterium sp.]